MLQDINPSFLNIEFGNKEPDPSSFIMIFNEGELLVSYDGVKIGFPTFEDVGSYGIFLFNMDGDDYFLNFQSDVEIDDFEFMPMKELRKLDTASNKELFAAFTAFHLMEWYGSSVYCGKCGEMTVFDKDERAMLCEKCNKKIYPRINPAVIVGIKNKDKLLITKYRSGYAHSALVAGFSEIGETLEDTVRREVMEEVGLKVENITYYKSQPWGIAGDLLCGFFCDVCGDDTITMDEGELKSACWVTADDIELQPNDISLTNDMMKAFKNHML
ncbi:MAG: NAD(+) diphosphatase [Lachnospiraceae bacterium]|nr:NAD(+) diphosphatase [Lachnospiraceae bacterium]